MNILLSELDIAARTVWGEARGESHHDQLAVAHVIHNRWKKEDGQFRRDDTLATTCLRHVQYSAWNKGDPNFQQLYAVQYDSKSLRLCMMAVLEVLNGGRDFTAGALHYHTHAVSPPWAGGHEPCYETSAHKFYNTVK